jgi:hypothetical protein
MEILNKLKTRSGNEVNITNLNPDSHYCIYGVIDLNGYKLYDIWDKYGNYNKCGMHKYDIMIDGLTPHEYFEKKGLIK